MKDLISRALIVISSWDIWSSKVRIRILRISGMEIGAKCVISNGVVFNSNRIRVGGGTLINKRCHMYCSSSSSKSGTISIGCNVSIACDVLICTSTHDIGSISHRAGKNHELDVKIGDGTWIGTRAVILPGVTIGNGCVIAAGAVVAHNCKEQGLYAGVPAKLIKRLS